MAQTNGHSTNGHSTNGHSVEEVVLTTETEFPLSVNHLEGLARFESVPAGLSLVSDIAAPKGAHFAYLTSHVPQPSPIWRTIQTSPTTHTDPRSALLYMNHSCQPSVEVHVFSPNAEGKYPQVPPNAKNSDAVPGVGEYGIAGEVIIAKEGGIKPGDPLTFFYPSTEWSMDRPFDCLCGAPEGVCLGKVGGANLLSQEQLQRWHFNDHIHKLAAKRDGSQ